MGVTRIPDPLRFAASKLAQENRDAESSISKTFLFPAANEIRLIHVDTKMSPMRNGDRIAPFYFGRDKSAGLEYRSAVALVRPEDVGRAALPEGWGEWDNAEVLWEAP
jgi:hypothetical protein